MIYLHEVGYKVSSFRKEHLILSGLNGQFNRNEKIGIFAAPGSGKTTLAKLISGIEQPSEGVIFRNGKVSWPIGFSGFFHPELSGYDNISLIAQMAGEDPFRMISICIQFGCLREEMNKPLKKFSPASRAILGYCCSISVYADIYVADEVISVGDHTMRKKCDLYMEHLLKNSGLIFISKNINQLKKYCTRFYVLLNSTLVECSSPEIASKTNDTWHKELNNHSN